MADSRKFAREDGDWPCPDSKCGNLNFAKRYKCNRCGAKKEYNQPPKMDGPSEIGSDAAEKSKGLFSAEDWQCKMCGNVNWARRDTCNMCNAPRFGKLEQRSGYGGGFMERDESVEYKETRATKDDDEYDQFGRKKKTFRIKSAAKPHRQPTPPPADEDDEDEEDDDDEDGDISAYKLDSDDEVEDDVAEDKSNAKSNAELRSSSSGSRSRSSSRSSVSSSRRGRKRSYSRSRSRSRSRSGSHGKRRRSNSRDRSRRSRS